MELKDYMLAVAVALGIIIFTETVRKLAKRALRKMSGGRRYS